MFLSAELTMQCDCCEAKRTVAIPLEFDLWNAVKVDVEDICRVRGWSTSREGNIFRCFCKDCTEAQRKARGTQG